MFVFRISAIVRQLNSVRPENFFAMISLVMGLLLACLTAPFQSPDEPAHYLRTWQLSTGQIAADHYGGQVPISLCDCWTSFASMSGHPQAKTTPAAILHEFHRPLAAGRTQFALFANTSLYSPVPYLPQTLAVFLGRCLALPPIALMYLGRCANALACSAIGWLTIRIVPLLKWPACLILASPLPLFLAGSLSADPMTIALAFLASATVLQLITGAWPLAPSHESSSQNNQKVSPLHSAFCIRHSAFILLLTLSWLGAALCKWAYGTVYILVIAVPAGAWGKGRRRLIPLGITGTCVLAFAAWSAVSKPMHVPERNGDPAPHLHWIESHPLQYAMVLAQTVRLQGPTIIWSSIGVLGWLDTLLSPIFVIFYMAVTLWATLNDTGNVRLNIATRLLAATAFLSSAVIAATCNYLVWDPTGAPIVEGLQGRYFLPLGLMLLTTFRRAGRWIIPPVAIQAIIVASCGYTLVAVGMRYY